MGNATVTPAAHATSLTPNYPTFASAINPDTSAVPAFSTTTDIFSTTVIPITSSIPAVPVSSPTLVVPVTSPIPAVPITSRISEIPGISPTHAIAVTSPTHVFPIHSPIPAIPVTSPTHAIPVTSATHVFPVHSPIPTIPVTSSTRAIAVTSPTHVFPIHSPIPAIPVTSPTHAIPVTSATHVFPVHSPIPAIPVTSPTHAIPVTSPTHAVPAHSPIPAIPVTSPTHAIPVTSSAPTAINIPVNYSNFTPVISPDSSAVSPTIDFPTSPIPSPIPLKSTTSANVIRSDTRITTYTLANPATPVAASANGISTTPLPTKVTFKRTISKILKSSVISNAEQNKPTFLSSADRWQKWNKFEQKQRDQHQELFHTGQQPNSLDTSTPPPSTYTDEDQKVIPVIEHIVAVPSFQLRTTAVCSLPQDDRVSLERTQSIHTNISIFKYHQTQRDPKLSIGNHTKATMFKMNTRLKQTPLPTPSLLLITRNFNDGTNQTEDNSTTAPTFVSLGLQNDLELDPTNHSLSQFRVKEKEQQKILPSSSSWDYNSSSNNSLYYTSSSTIIQPSFSTIEKPSVRNTRQPPTSILKKSSSQVIHNPFSMQTNSKVFEELQKNDFENHPSTVSFNIPSRSTKASQSILRSEKLFSSRSFHRKK